MSINHILYETVPEDEKLDVKFKNVYCDQVISGDVPTGGDGHIDAITGASISSPTANVSVSTFAPSYSTGIKNHSTFIWTFKTEVNMNANLGTFDLDVRLPDSIKTYFDAHPSAFATYFISAMGMCNTTTSSATFEPNQMYYANQAVKHSADTVRITFISSTLSGTGTIPQLLNSNLQLIFSGPAN